MRAELVVMVVLALSSSACGLDELVQWVMDNGGRVDGIEVKHSAQGLRGLYAKQSAKAGDVLATFPGSTFMNCGASHAPLMTGAMLVLRELKDPHSRFRPYIKAWPQPDKLLHACNFPPKYLPLLEEPYWVMQVNVTQAWLAAALRGGVTNGQLELTVREVAGSARVSEEELRYACAIASTRTVVLHPRPRLVMIPLFDMANHRPGCPHNLSFPHAGGSAQLVAGADVQAGEELCFSYHAHMRDDFAVMRYGFLPPAQHPPRLMQVDHHQFTPTAVMQDLSDVPFSGFREQVIAEINRQQATLTWLEHNRGREADARVSGPEPGQDWVYDMLVALQQRRRAALRHEIQRLKDMLQLWT